MRKTLFAVILIVFAALLGVYTWLGGFKEATLDVVKNQQYTIVGQYFFGKSKSDTLRRYFESARQYQQKAGGTLCVVYYDEANQPQDTVANFIGVANPNGTASLPANFEARTFNVTKGVRATMEVHYSVRPAASDVSSQIAEFAQVNQMALQKLSLEFYQANGNLQVVVPVQE